MSRRRNSASGAHRVSDTASVDFFPTPPWAARAGAELVKRLDPGAGEVWEPACGAGHMAHGLAGHFHVWPSDAYDYGWDHCVVDFTAPEARASADLLGVDWIITNPPFAPAAEFVRLGLDRARRGVAMLLRLGWLESEARFDLLYGARPLSVLAPFSERVCMLDGRYEPDGSTAQAYAWFIWDKARHPAALGADLWSVSTAQRGPVVWPIPPGTRARLTRPSDAAFAARDVTPCGVTA